SRHPVAVMPLVLERPDARGRSRRHLPLQRERIALIGREAAVTRAHVILVTLSPAGAGDETLPYAGMVCTLRERVTLPVPAVEVADDGDARRVRRPHGELHARPIVVRAGMCTEHAIQAGMRSFAEVV